jgi:hypothetical protein
MNRIVILFALLVLFSGCKTGVKPAMLAENPETSSDSSLISVVKPLTESRTITVGGAKADIPGFTSRAIQTAVNALRQEGGGGTIILLPGTFIIEAPVTVYSSMTLTGSGEKTILKKCRGYSSPFAIDADYGELQVTVRDASGFAPGMGVAIYDDPQRYGFDLTTAKIIAIKGNTLFIDTYLVNDYNSEKGGTVSNACSVISAVDAGNVTIKNLTVDGSGDTNEMIDGCRAGGVYLHKVKNALVENVTVRNFDSDGISWQITENVTVRNCEVYGCTNSGLHPGTGSPYTLVEGNKSHDNGGYGLFVCWRVRQGVVKNNEFFRNGNNGICTGHKDTDMLYAGNHVFENGSDGIHLRGETDLNAPHRSIFRDNIIENNGTKEGGYGFSVNSKAEGVVLENNVIRNRGAGKQLAAIYLTKNSLPVEMKNNTISGHPEGEDVNELNK